MPTPEWGRARRSDRWYLARVVLGAHCGRCRTVLFDAPKPSASLATTVHIDHFECSVTGVRTARSRVWLLELVKCQILCEDCHRAKSHENGDLEWHSHIKDA